MRSRTGPPEAKAPRAFAEQSLGPSGHDRPLRLAQRNGHRGFVPFGHRTPFRPLLHALLRGLKGGLVQAARLGPRRDCFLGMATPPRKTARLGASDRAVAVPQARRAIARGPNATHSLSDLLRYHARFNRSQGSAVPQFFRGACPLSAGPEKSVPPLPGVPAACGRP